MSRVSVLDCAVAAGRLAGTAPVGLAAVVLGFGAPSWTRAGGLVHEASHKTRERMSSSDAVPETDLAIVKARHIFPVLPKILDIVTSGLVRRT